MPSHPEYCTECYDRLTWNEFRRGNGLCDSCEFDSLTPDGWFPLFLKRLAQWQTA